MSHQAGTSLVETIATLAIIALFLGGALANLEPAEAPLQTGSMLVEGLILQARSSAMATTSAYRIVPDGAGRLLTEHADRCSDASWTSEPGNALDLPDEVTLSDTDWTVCFGRRGLSTANLTVTLVHPDFGSRQVEVLLGGTTRVLS